MAWEILFPIELSKQEVEAILKARQERGEKIAHDRGLRDARNCLRNEMTTNPRWNNLSNDVKQEIANYVDSVCIEIDRKQEART